MSRSRALSLRNFLDCSFISMRAGAVYYHYGCVEYKSQSWLKSPRIYFRQGEAPHCPPGYGIVNPEFCGLNFTTIAKVQGPLPISEIPETLTMLMNYWHSLPAEVAYRVWFQDGSLGCRLTINSLVRNGVG